MVGVLIIIGLCYLGLLACGIILLVDGVREHKWKKRRKEVKVYRYNADNIFKGQYCATSPKGVRRYLRRLFGLATYLRIRKYLVIEEAVD